MVNSSKLVVPFTVHRLNSELIKVRTQIRQDEATHDFDNYLWSIRHLLIVCPLLGNIGKLLNLLKYNLGEGCILIKFLVI